MFYFFFTILLTNFSYLILGKYVSSRFFKNLFHYSIEFLIIGLISVGFIAFIINFFLPLNVYVNSIFTLIILTSLLFFKISLNRDELIMCIITSILVLFLIIYDNEYRPDAGLYHLPFTQILNESNIIIGLTNIHSRFGHTSIVQYLAAANYNFFNGINGILIPLASSISFILLYFLIDLRKIVSNKFKELSIGNFFSLIATIYIIYKINRYSEFGNDATAHIFLFYIISVFLPLSPFLDWSAVIKSFAQYSTV